MRSVLAGLAPNDVRVGVRLIDIADEVTLFVEERSALKNAVPKRRAEFASGRVLLRELLGSDVAIPAVVGGAPLLPGGLAASVAHDRKFVVAAVAANMSIAAIGIDVEPFTSLDPNELDVIMRADDAPVDPVAAFVMKEAAYKAWSSLGGDLLDHHDVRIGVNADTFTADVIAAGRRFEGHWATAAERWIALIVVASGA